MAEIRRLVTLDATGTATVIKDINTSPYQSVAGSTVITPPPPNAILAKRERRYGGGQVVGERHDNGAFAWKMIVGGTSVDNMLLNVQSLTAIFQAARTDLFLEWRPDGATSSTFYEIAGPVIWKPTYEWKQSVQVFSMYVDIEIPFKPLGLLAAQTFAISSSTLPIVFSMTGITGDAPALANVTLRTSGGTAAPIWCLLGWCQHPTTALSSSVAPFGIIEAETGTSLSGWSLIGADATYRGSNGLRVTTSGAGTASASFALDPSTIPADDFSSGEVDIEVWARIEVASTVVSPVMTCSLVPNAGASFGNASFATPFGSSGALVVLPSSGTQKRRVRLGVLTMPVDAVTPLRWNAVIGATWQTGSSGSFGFDYLKLVPVRQRACSKSGVANDVNYPHFITSTSDTSKTIFGYDLSGKTGSAAANQGRDSGLGGSPIELPTGSVDMLLHLSSLVPGDPTLDTTSEQLSHTGVTGSVVVFPRVFLAKGQ